MPSSSSESLQELFAKQLIWRGGDRQIGTDGLPTGSDQLDEFLPMNGWPRGGVTEIQLPATGIGEINLLLPVIAQSTHRSWVTVINPPATLNPHYLATAEVALERLIVVQQVQPIDALWAAEQSLRHGHCGLVLLWQSQLDTSHWRRLQLAAETSNRTVMVWQPCGTPARHVALSLRLTAQPKGLAITLLRGQGCLHQRQLSLA